MSKFNSTKTKSYTEYMECSISEYYNELFIKNFIKNSSSELFEPEEYLKKLNDLAKDEYRTFAKGLTELLEKCGYKGDTNNTEALINYLSKKLEELKQLCEDNKVSIPSSQTLRNWFNKKAPNKKAPNKKAPNKKAPNKKASNKEDPNKEAPSPIPGSQTSREYMFLVCFALNAKLENVIWFFERVYFERAFNFRDKKECIYYYCFANELNYKEARDLIHECNVDDPSTPNASMEPIYTNEIQNEIEVLTSKKDRQGLLDYFEENKYIFNIPGNKKIVESISKAIVIISNFIKGDIDTVKKIETETEINYTAILKEMKINYTAILKEILGIEYGIRKSFKVDDLDKEYTEKQKEILKNKFSTSSKKEFEDICISPQSPVVPEIISRNFPRKQMLSEFKKYSEDSSCKVDLSYEALRKCFILFEFYRFWKIFPKTEFEKFTKDPEPYKTFRDQMDADLRECGYQKLSETNLYDHVFIFSSYIAQQKKSPDAALEFLQDFILAIEDALFNEANKQVEALLKD